MSVTTVCNRISEAFGKENTKYVLEELKNQGFGNASVPLSSFTWSAFQVRFMQLLSLSLFCLVTCSAES